jgi:pimeloyl-ACP methyl ester carboxylesterase
MIHGDDFAPHPDLKPFARRLEPDGLFFYDAGPNHNSVTGSVVLMLHGNGDEADTWRHVLPIIAEQYRVIAPDLPGFGRSRPFQQPTGQGSGQGSEQGDLQNLAAGVLRILESQKVKSMHLIGSSMGAVIACMIAPHVTVSSLVLCGGSAPGLGLTEPSAGVKALLEPGMGEQYYTGLRDAGIDAAFETLKPYYANLEQLPAADRAFLRDRVWARVWSDSQRSAFFAGLRSLFDPNLIVDVSGLEDLRTLLLWGEHDQIMPIQAAHALRAHLPHARLEVIPGAGHLPHQERPEAFASTIEAFWRRP